MSNVQLRGAECGLRNYPLPCGERTKVRGDTPNGACPRMTLSGELRTPNLAGVIVRLLLTATLLFEIFQTTAAYATTGREVYEKFHNQRSKWLDHKIEATMVLFDKGGGKRTRSLTQYGKKADPEAYRTLVVFNSPPDLKNVGFLIHAHTFSDRDLWAYFPEYKRVRRIAAGSQDDSFFGSDLSYDDFGGPPNLDDYKFSILKEEVFDGRPCYVVEVTPKVRRKYTKYISWVAKELWIHLKIEYYQDNDVYRAGTFRDVRTIDGLPTPFRTEMENRKTNHRTEFTIDSVQYHTHFPDDLFTQRSLERSGR